MDESERSSKTGTSGEDEDSPPSPEPISPEHDSDSVGALSTTGSLKPKDSPQEVKPEEVEPEEVEPEEVKPEEVEPEEVKPQEVKPQEVEPEEVKPEEVEPEEVKPQEVEPEEVKPEEVEPEELKPQEVKPEELKPQEVKPEELNKVPSGPVKSDAGSGAGQTPSENERDSKNHISFDASRLLSEDVASGVLTKEEISRQLLQALEEDSKEFTELDIKEMMPSSPFTDASFHKLKEFYHNVLQDMNTANRVGIPLDELKEEFHFLWEGIQKSHDSLNDLLQKDVDLTMEVADTMAKTRNLIRIVEDNPEITARLGSRLETAWNLVDISEEEAQKNANRIEEIKTDIMILNRNIQAAANMQGKTELNELLKIRRKLQDERDALHKDMGKMRTSLALLLERKSRLGEKRTEYQDSIRYADEEMAAQYEALDRETERKQNIEEEIEMLTEAIEVKRTELEESENKLNVAKVKLVEYERGVTAQKVMNDTSLKDTEAAFSKLDKLKTDFDSQVLTVEKLMMETFKKQSDLREKEREILKIKAEGLQATRQRNINLKRCAILQERLTALEDDRETLKQKIIDLEKELEMAQNKLAENKRKVEDLDKKRTVVNKNLTRAKALADEHNNQLKVHLVATNNLEREMHGYRREIEDQTSIIHRLERERDFYSNEATKLAHEFASRLEEVKKMDTIVFEFQKKISELEGTIKSKDQEYEQSLVEKRFFETLVRDTGTAIVHAQTEVRHRTFELNMSIFNYYDGQLKFEQSKATLENLLREGTFFQVEADRIRKMVINMQREVEALESERSLLGVGVAEAENELSKQRYYAMQAESRRKNYNRKVQETEADLKEIWSTWRTLHSMVRIGAYHFRILMKEIREIRQSIVDLRRIQHKFKGTANSIVQLQQEISVLENCIAKETCMVNALEDELTRPINVHRWRALEAIDPDAYDTIRKIMVVTKRLVDQNECIRRQSMRIHDKERMYIELQHVIRRLPSLETPELRKHYEVLLASKKHKLKEIKSELYSMESQTQYYRNEVLKVNKRMNELKEIYFAKMKSGEMTLQPKKMTSASRAKFVEKIDQELRSDADTDKVGVASVREIYKRHTNDQEKIMEELAKISLDPAEKAAQQGNDSTSKVAMASIQDYFKRNTQDQQDIVRQIMESRKSKSTSVGQIEQELERSSTTDKTGMSSVRKIFKRNTLDQEENLKNLTQGKKSVSVSRKREKDKSISDKMDQLQVELTKSDPTEQIGMESVRKIYKRYTEDQDEIMKILDARKSMFLVKQKDSA